MVSDIHFNCPACRQSLEAPSELANQLTDCPKCGEVIEVPTRSHRTNVASVWTPPVPLPPVLGKNLQTAKQSVNNQTSYKTCSKCRCVSTPAQSYCPGCGSKLSEIAQPETVSAVAKCRVCRKDVSPSAETCPHCGEHSPATIKQCPKCNSMRVTASEGTHYGFGKAATGALILGPLGLLAGFLPTKSTFFKCSDCGEQFM